MLAQIDGGRLDVLPDRKGQQKITDGWLADVLEKFDRFAGANIRDHTGQASGHTDLAEPHMLPKKQPKAIMSTTCVVPGDECFA